MIYATVWANLENILRSEISQSQKDKCHWIPPILPRVANIIETGSQTVAVGGREEGELLFKGRTASVLQGGNVPEVGGTTE